jgi:DNA-binding response OmpR family regulator
MRILIVEDEERLARSLKKGLEKKGFAVDHVDDGERAATRISLHRDQYDLIILDLMLPGQSGLSVCRAVREHGITTPILVLTAKQEIVDKVILLSSGADDYLVKPFSFQELHARIQALLRRPREALPITLSAQDIYLDTGMRKVFRKNKEIPLTTKEFVLLEFFMRNPNQALDREYILDHLWNFEFDSFSNVIDVHVKNLRKKLGDTKRNQLLETVRGVGYRLKA